MLIYLWMKILSMRIAILQLTHTRTHSGISASTEKGQARQSGKYIFNWFARSLIIELIYLDKTEFISNPFCCQRPQPDPRSNLRHSKRTQINEHLTRTARKIVDHSVDSIIFVDDLTVFYISSIASCSFGLLVFTRCNQTIR